MNNNEDECFEYAKMIDSTMELLIHNYYSLKKMDYKNDSSMEDISDINKLSQDIAILITNVESKIKFARNVISHCSLNHDDLIKKVAFKESSNEKLKTKFYKEREEMMTYFATYVPKQPSINNANYKDLSEYNMDELMFEEEKLKKVKEYVYENEKEMNMCPKDKEDIIKVKNQIKELMVLIKEQIDETNGKLVQIDDKVDETYENILKGNKELKEAALVKNKTKRWKYQAILGTVLGTVGSVLPGIGNAIGIALGVGIGAGIAKIEEKAINKIGKKKK